MYQCSTESNKEGDESIKRIVNIECPIPYCQATVNANLLFDHFRTFHSEIPVKTIEECEECSFIMHLKSFQLGATLCIGIILYSDKKKPNRPNRIRFPIYVMAQLANHYLINFDDSTNTLQSPSTTKTSVSQTSVQPAEVEAKAEATAAATAEGETSTAVSVRSQLSCIATAFLKQKERPFGHNTRAYRDAEFFAIWTVVALPPEDIHFLIQIAGNGQYTNVAVVAPFALSESKAPATENMVFKVDVDEAAKCCNPEYATVCAKLAIVKEVELELHLK